MNKYYKLINRTYQDVHDLIIALENKRDNGKGISDLERNILEKLHAVWESCRNTGLIPSSFVEFKGAQMDFSFVNAKWIEGMIKKSGVSKSEFAKGVNVQDTQVSRWVSPNYIPSGPAQAAIYYYFERISK